MDEIKIVKDYFTVNTTAISCLPVAIENYELRDLSFNTITIMSH